VRLAFLGTPEAAVVPLRALVDAGHDVALVITRPDRKRGRGGQLSASPVKVCAQELGLAVAHRLSALDDLDVERGVVVAYGRLIPEELLERIPMLNVHFSLLPRWRGAAPVERAILAGDEETGVSIMTLEAALDTGPVHLEERVAIGEKSLTTLLDELAGLGARALVEVLGSPELLGHAHAQEGDVTYAAKLTKEEFHLSANASAVHVLRTVRLGQAFIVVEGRRLLVQSATSCEDEDVASASIALRDGRVILGVADGAIVLERVRPESAKSMSALAWWSGRHFENDAAQWT
jgi:methionyl-tRNA formyltransferase